MKAKQKKIEPIDEDSQYLIDQLYQAIPTSMIMPDGKIVDVPDSGNIGLLANGYRGIIAWRKTREKLYGTRLYSPYIEALKRFQSQNKKNQDA